MGDPKRVAVRVGADTKEFEAKMKRVQASLEKLGDVGKTLTTHVTLPLLAIGGAALKMAMDAEESDNLFTVSMGNMAEAARRWSEEYGSALGLNRYRIRQMLGTFNVMLTSMGMGEQQALDMSKALAKLTYDMSSFYDLSPEIAFEKIQSGLSGEVEPLKRLGIVLNDTKVKLTAYKNGIAEYGSELTEVQKVQARYIALMDLTRKAQGDLDRTKDSSTNKLRREKEQLEEMAVEIGKSLVPVMEVLLEVLKDATGWWKKQSDPMQEFYIKLGLIAMIAGPVAMGLGAIAKALATVYKYGALLYGLRLVGLGKLITALRAAPFLLNPYTLAAGAGAGLAWYASGAGDARKEAAKRRREATASAKAFDETGQPSYRGVASDLGLGEKWESGDTTAAEKKQIRDEYRRRFNAWMAQKQAAVMPSTPTPTVDPELEAKKAKEAKEAAEELARIREEEARAAGDYAADYLRLIGRTYDAERQEAYNNYRSEMAELESLQAKGEDVRNRMAAAHMRYAAQVSEVNRAQADEQQELWRQAAEEQKRRIEEMRAAWEAELERTRYREEGRRDLFERIHIRMIELTQGELAARLQALEYQREAEKRSAAEYANSAEERARIFSAIDADIDAQKQQLHNAEMQRLTDEAQAEREKRNAQVGFITSAKSLWENFAIAGAKLSRSISSGAPSSGAPSTEMSNVAKGIESMRQTAERQLAAITDQTELLRRELKPTWQ